MLKFDRAIVFSAVLVSSMSLLAQQSGSVCDVALTEKAYDTDKSITRYSIMGAKRAELCSRQYSNSGEANSAARSTGFGVSYSGFGLEGSQAKQNSNGSWDISQEAFCTTAENQLDRYFAGATESTIANIAVNAWRDCVLSANVNSLFIDYKISPDGNYFRGTLRTTANTGPLQRQITGISVGGIGSKEVVCNIGGKNVKPEDVLDNPIEVKTTGTAVLCEKSKDGGVSISIQTSADNVPFIDLPSPESLEILELDKLSNRVSELEKGIEPSRIRAHGLTSLPGEGEKSLDLGNYSYCALSTAGEAHSSQSCICIVSRPTISSWKLVARADSSVQQNCACGVMCIE